MHNVSFLTASIPGRMRVRSMEVLRGSEQQRGRIIPCLYSRCAGAQVGFLVEVASIRAERERGVSRYNGLAAYESVR